MTPPFAASGVLVAFTVLEIVIVLGVLAAFAILLVRLFSSIGSTLAQLGLGVRAVEQDLAALPDALARANHRLEAIGAASTRAAESAERKAGP